MLKKKNGIYWILLEIVVGIAIICVMTGIFAGINALTYRYEFFLTVIGGFNRLAESGDFYEVFGTMLGISYSVIFLTITLLSSLSDKDETIYWERFTEYALVNPPVFNFLGMSIMGFESLAIETIFFMFCSGILRAYVFMASFTFGIIIVTCLFFRMSGVYFNRERYLWKLEKEYLANKEAYYSGEIGNKTVFRTIQNKLQQLQRYTVSAAEKKNIRVVYDNIDFFIKHSGFEDDGLSDRLLEKKYTKNEINLAKNDLITRSVQGALFATLDDLDSLGEENLIINVIQKYIDVIDTKEGKYVFTNWIASEKTRLNIWNAYSSELKARNGNKDISRELIKNIVLNTTRIMREFEITNDNIKKRVVDESEDEAVQAFLEFNVSINDLEQKREKTRERYKKNITKKLQLFFEHCLENEFIRLLRLLMFENDPVNPVNDDGTPMLGTETVIDVELGRGFFYYFISQIDDEHCLEDLILACYQAIHFPDFHEFYENKDITDKMVSKINLENERRCIEAIRRKVSGKETIGKGLQEAYHKIMREQALFSKDSEQYTLELIDGIRQKKTDEGYLIELLYYTMDHSEYSEYSHEHWKKVYDFWIGIHDKANGILSDKCQVVLDRYIEYLKEKMQG